MRNCDPNDSLQQIKRGTMQNVELKQSDCSPTMISLERLLNEALKARNRIIASVAAFFILGAIYALIAQPVFRASTTIMPPQQQSTASALFATLGGAGLPSVGSSSLGSALGLKNPNDIYVAMLKSERIANTIITQNNLLNYYKTEYKTQARKRLEKASQITARKDGLIEISVLDKDPILAAKIANEYVKELWTLTQSLSLSEASQRKKYYETQLRIIRDSLTEAEIALKIFQERTGIVNAEIQATASLEAAAQLRSQIASKELELKILSTALSPQNNQIINLSTTISGLKKELASLMNGQGDDVWLARGKAPSIGLENARITRNLKYYGTLFEITAKQFEIARMDESKDASQIQVIDTAQAPELRDGPKRLRIIAATTLIGTALSVICLMLMAFLRIRNQTDLTNSTEFGSNAKYSKESKPT